jgi:hypothetical protein
MFHLNVRVAWHDNRWTGYGLYAQHLVHRTSKNVMVQSKSELTLATYFASSDVGLGDYTYNRKLDGEGYRLNRSDLNG